MSLDSTVSRFINDAPPGEVSFVAIGHFASIANIYLPLRCSSFPMSLKVLIISFRGLITHSIGMF